MDGKSGSHCSGLSDPPTLDELMGVCLPLTPTPENYHIVQQGHSALIRSHALNLRPVQIGQIMPGVFGLQVGVALPFVHVVRYNGRCYLHNGYHRVCGALAAGATEVPCVVRDVGTPQEAGIVGGMGTFDLPLLEGPSPPTLSDFNPTQAHAVSLVVKTRVMHVTWTDWVAPEF
jgi:hypothetical protein